MQDARGILITILHFLKTCWDMKMMQFTVLFRYIIRENDQIYGVFFRQILAKWWDFHSQRFKLGPKHKSSNEKGQSLILWLCQPISSQLSMSRGWSLKKFIFSYPKCGYLLSKILNLTHKRKFHENGAFFRNISKFQCKYLKIWKMKLFGNI